MPTIEFSGNALGAAVSVEAQGGGRLLDVCDETRAPVAFSCRSASCGICRVQVLEGACLLEPPMREELAVLELFSAPSDERLACQAVIRAGAGLIKLRWIRG